MSKYSQSLNPILKSFWRTKARNKILYGGRASSKSHDAAGMAIFLSQRYTLKFLCVRQFQNKIADSVYSLLKIKISVFGLDDDFIILDNCIKHKYTGSEFMFYGLARNITEIKSIEGVDILWSEESHLLTEQQWEILEPTIRKENSECWIIFNPNLITDFVWKRFVVNPPPNTIIKKINYDENPFLSQTMIGIIEAVRLEDPEKHEHIYLGEPKSNDDEAIIKRSHVMAAIDAHIKLGIDVSGSKRIGFDVADDGEDACATVSAYGVLTTGIELWQAREDEILKSCAKVYRQALDIGNAEITYDAIGVGASCGGKFNELGYSKHKKFLAGGAVINGDKAIDKFNESRPQKDRILNKDYYCNIKAQAWWSVAERLRNTYSALINGQKFDQSEMIFIDSSLPHIEQLVNELCTPRKSYDNAGRVMVESKKDLKKRGISSPNCFVAGTLIETNNGSKPIELLDTGDLVLTPMGYSKITYLHQSESIVISKLGLTGTPEHKIFTWNKGWVQLQTLSLCDIIEPLKIGGLKWRIMNRLYTKARCSGFSTQVDIIAQGIGENVKTMDLKDFYTAGFGLNITAKFLQNTTSIILTAIGAITELKTLSASREATTTQCTWSNDLKTKFIGKKISKTLIEPEKRLQNGTSQRTVRSGIANTQNNSLAKDLLKNIFVLFVEKVFYQEKLTSQTLAPHYAQQNAQTIELQNNSNQIVENADSHLTIQNYQEKMNTRDAQGNAQNQLSAKVYNITLAEHNVYYANGILVKNCADAFIMAHLQLPKKSGSF